MSHVHNFNGPQSLICTFLQNPFMIFPLHQLNIMISHLLNIADILFHFPLIFHFYNFSPFL
jgi:hypothetical protein